MKPNEITTLFHYDSWALERVWQCISQLSDEQLDETIPWELPARRLKLSNQRWELLLHVVNHGTDGRAQILAILHDHFRLQTNEQVLIMYVGGQKRKPESPPQ